MSCATQEVDWEAVGRAYGRFCRRSMAALVAEADRLRRKNAMSWERLAAEAELPASVSESIRDTLAGREPAFFALTREDIGGLARALNVATTRFRLQFIGTDMDETAALAELREASEALAPRTRLCTRGAGSRTAR